MLNLPNILTMLNLFCGCCAFLLVVQGRVDMAAWFTLASFLFDYADGMAARALKIASPLGKELDSLADVISFGAVPAAMLYVMLVKATGGSHAFVAIPGGTTFLHPEALPAFVLAMFSGLRLGKFNLDTRQAHYFIGLSTPACTVFVLGLALAVHHGRFQSEQWLLNPWLLYGLVGILSYLLISEIPMFGMKIKRLDLRSNALLLGFAVVFAALWFFLHELAFSVIIVLYVLTSIFLKKNVIAST